MPTATELVRLAVKLSEKTADEKIADLQKQIDELKRIINQLVLEKEQSGMNLVNCRRCGRMGHWTVSCRAKTHVDGYDLDSNDSEYNSE